MVLFAILLPWSTTGAAIAAAIWFIGQILTLEPAAFLRSLKRPICALPVAMFVLALVGTLWSDAPWGERLYAIGPVAKLLTLPLLLYHFERTSRGAMGLHCLPCVLPSADAGLMGGRLRSQPLAQALFLARAL